MFHTVNGSIVYFDVQSHNVLRDDNAPRNPYASGYGKKIPTAYRVRVFDNKFHRVYCACYSNSGTMYIMHNGSRCVVRF